MKHRLTSTLVWTRRVGPNIFQQRFHQPTIARAAKAGQFVHILPADDLLFRRAFSIYAADPKAGTYDVLHQVLGVGTRSLANDPVGSELDTLGPLGNRFTPPPPGHTAVLVGGGLGMAPLRLWALEQLRQSSRRRSAPLPVMILGVRTKAQAVAPYQLAQHGLRPVWASDDGSKGFHGTAVALFDHLVQSGKLNGSRIAVYGCGPEPMMSALAKVCAAHGTFCEVSLERSMPCGYGVCMGCVVQGRDRSGYETFLRVCRDGPVFDASTIVF
ncbi:MAG TPA: dihydroorotate dehydrogenase electron transfer subunit [bacterium]|nr:dihydroorotate dehydrogenase electron transfer subunit [bacterium]